MPVPAVHMCRGRRGSSFHTLAVSDSHPRTDARPCLASADLPPSLGCRSDRLLFVARLERKEDIAAALDELDLVGKLFDTQPFFNVYFGRVGDLVKSTEHYFSIPARTHARASHVLTSLPPLAADLTDFFSYPKQLHCPK